MIRLLLARLLPYRSFPKFLVLHAVAVMMVAYVASRFTSVSVQGSAQVVSRLFEGPVGWHTVAVLTKWAFFIPAFFTVQLVAAELELKLVRFQIVAGLEPRDVVAGWSLQSALLALFGAVVAAVIAFLLGASGLGDALMTGLGFFLFGLVFLCGAVCVTCFLRRPVPSLVLLLLWPLALEPLLGLILGYYGLDSVKGLLPFSAMSALVPWPADGLPVNPSLSPATILGVAYGVVAALVSWLKLSRSDL